MISLSLTDAAKITLIIVVFFCIITIIFFYFYIKREIRKKNQNTFSKKPTKNRNKINLKDNLKDLKFTSPKSVESDGVLPGSSTLIGVVALEAYAREKDPQYIIGINRGGWLLSTYLAHRLDIDREHLLRFDSNKNEIIDNNINKARLKGKRILLVDDISRKGDSIKKAHEYVKNQFPDSSFSTVVLVICGENPSQELIDFHPYYTEYPDIQLPWSDEERKKEARENLAKAGLNKVIYLDDLDSLRVKSPVLKIAGENKSEGMDIFNDDIDIMLDSISRDFINHVTV
jgi:hypoxanthine phosphoribosyltransferase